MEHVIEKDFRLPHVTVQLATVNWEGIEETPPYGGYCLSQRLSEDHSPLRIGNFPAPEVLPRVRSLGFLPPDSPVRLFPVERPLRVLYCIFDELFFERETEVPREQWARHTGALFSVKNKRLEVLMQEIYAELEQPGFGHEIVIEAASKLILVELARYIKELERKGVRQGSNLALAPWQLQRIHQRIQGSLEMGYPSLSELAELCGISQSHLTRTFKASTGWQIHQYIAGERIKAAKELLALEGFSCSEVSSRLGFKSPAYFATAFRRIAGKTPTEFRKQALARKIGCPAEDNL